MKDISASTNQCWISCKSICITAVITYLVCAVFYQFLYEEVDKIIPKFILQDKYPSQQTVDIHNSSISKSSSVMHRTFMGEITLDIHPEHPSHGHAGVVPQNHDVEKYLSGITIAVGGGITSARLAGITPDNIPLKFQLFVTFLPSFCKTMSKGYHYHFYWAYDHTDSFFSNRTLLKAFQNHFINMTSVLCPTSGNTSISIHMVQCSHTKSPAWAQNDAMMEAYLDGMEYYYRINDDTVLSSSKWVEAFIDTLASYNPPNVGVVGPKHSRGNTRILTYDFVHRSHLDIFGFYYPRVFTDWFADTWITQVYQPDKMKKLSHINVKHTMKNGQRYTHHYAKGKALPQQLEVGKAMIQR